MNAAARRPPRDEPLEDLPPLADDGTAGPDGEAEEPDFDEIDALVDDETPDEDDLDSFVQDLANESWLDADDETSADSPVEPLPADEIDLVSWLDDGLESDEVDSELVDSPAAGTDDDGEGPESDPVHDSVEPAPNTSDPSLDDGDDDESAELPRESIPPAFALERAAATRYVTVSTDGAVLAAATSESRVLLCGEGIWEVSTAGLDPLDGGTRTARAILTGAGDVFSSVVRLHDRAWLAARMNGEILRSDDDGARWSRIGVLAGDGAARSSVQLVVDPNREGRVWARSHGGSILRSDDAGASWDGPFSEHAVRVLCAESPGGGIMALASTRSGGLVRTVDGATWEAVPFALPEALSCAARTGEVIAVASSLGTVRVSVNGGRTSEPWPDLYGAHYLLLLPTDDGAVRLVAAVGDAVASRTTLVEAVIGADGAPRGLNRFADIHDMMPSQPDGEDDDDERDTSVDALVPIDACGRRLVVVTSVGVAVVARGD